MVELGDLESSGARHTSVAQRRQNNASCPLRILDRTVRKSSRGFSTLLQMPTGVLFSPRVTERVRPIRIELEFLAQVHALHLVVEERFGQGAAGVVLSPFLVKRPPTSLLERLGELASYSGVTISINPSH
jgi:hypothetical protein